MRSTALFLCLVMVLPASAATWYVRPASGEYGAEDGTSYETAWDGIEGVNWGSVQPGDTVYICGQQLRYLSAGEGWKKWNIRPTITNGTSEDARVTLRGDYPGDPGHVWGCAAPSDWMDNGDGTYRFTLFANLALYGYLRDITAENTYTPLTRTTSLEECQSTEDSYYVTGSGSKNDLVYVHLQDGADPTGRVWLPRAGYDMYLVAKRYITFKNLSFYRMYQWMDNGTAGATTSPSHITFDGCYIRSCAEYWYSYTNHIVWRNCEILGNYAGAIYAIEWPRDGSGNGPSYFTISGCKIHNVRGNSDSHAIGTQGVNNFLIEKNEFYDCGSGPNINLQDATNSPTTNVIIRWNYIHDMHTEYGANGEGIKSGAVWAESQSAWTGCQIYGNVIANCTYGVNLTWGNTEIGVYNNTVYDCGTSFLFASATGPQIRFKNNISFFPSSYHVWYNSGSLAPDISSDYNCFYPISGNQFFRLWPNISTGACSWATWRGSSATGCTFDPHSITDDPLIVGTDRSDFRLAQGSPVIDAGIDVGLTSDKNGDGIPHGAGHDIGAYEYAEGYALTVAGPHGTIGRSPDKTSYVDGETVIVEAMPDAGYNFAGWSGDLTGSSNPATVVMDSNKTITANFVADAPALFTLSVTAGGGTVIRSPNKNGYNAGESVTLQAVPNAGHHFTGWSGDLGGAGNPAVLVMDRNRAVTAHFAANSYSLNVSATNGTANRNPDRVSYSYGETVTLNAVPDVGYEFDSWGGAVAGQGNPATLVMDSDKVVTASFRASSPDIKPPAASACEPQPGAIQVPLNSLVTLRIADDGRGVDANTVVISLGDTIVYTGNVSSYRSAVGVCRRIGMPATYTYAFQSDEKFDFDQTIGVAVQAADLAGNAMSVYSYSFATEMRAFGRNLEAVQGLDELNKGKPATVRDHAGDIWVVWEAGTVGTRDIYVARLAHGSDSFHDPVRLTTGAGDECNPALAVDEDGQLHVVWQDDRRGNWDIYARTSTDGSTWSAERRLTDSQSNHVHPAIAVDQQSPGRAYVAWQDDEAGHQDIYVASTQDGFATKAIWRVTSDASDQTDPQIVVDAYDTVYLVWTDGRNGADDIYGASSVAGPWTNVAFVTGAGHQHSPALAAEVGGTALHLAWVDDASGNQDIRYACTDGMPAGPLAGANVVDDTLGAHQSAPAIATAGNAGADLRVFLCWRDERNIVLNKSGGDADLYFVEVGTATATNILVGDGGTGSDQGEPSVGIDGSGHPYIVWTDNRTSVRDIYYCGSTYMNPEALASNLVSSAAGGTVGQTTITGLDDVSVVIPAGACLVDVVVTITPIVNPQPNSAASIIPYDFGPSGLEFSLPVTITIPYAVAEFGGASPVPCWYDSRTGTISQQGIAGVETLYISSAIHALRFQATHFTPYVLLPASTTPRDATGSPSGGGGCSLSPVGGISEALEFFIPYVLLASAMIVLRRRDAKRYRVSGERASRG